jgi:hypothetical protein
MASAMRPADTFMGWACLRGPDAAGYCLELCQSFRVSLSCMLMTRMGGSAAIELMMADPWGSGLRSGIFLGIL